MKTLSGLHKYLLSLVFLPIVSHASVSDDYLIEAILSGDHASVESLLKGGVDANYFLPDGSTPLAWAVETQDASLVELLLAEGANPNSYGSPSTAPIIIACQYGNSSILDQLLTSGAEVSVELDDGISALSVCAGNADVAIVEQLVESGANVKQASDLGQTPLMWAAMYGKIDTIEYLLEQGADINQTTHKGFTPLLFALKSGVPQAPITILEAGGDADYVAPDGTTVVQIAMYQGAYEFASLMIARWADLKSFDRSGYQLLHAAVKANQPELVQQLIAEGSELDALNGESKVTWRYEGNFKSDDYYVSPKTPLMLATENGFSEVMRVLADAGADTGFKTEEGANIVLVATTSGEFEALELALKLQPDANTKTPGGSTPLHILLENAFPDSEAMMRLLHEKGAKMDVQNNAGVSPFDMFPIAQQVAKDAFEKVFLSRITQE